MVQSTQMFRDNGHMWRSRTHVCACDAPECTTAHCVHIFVSHLTSLVYTHTQDCLSCCHTHTRTHTHTHTHTRTHTHTHIHTCTCDLALSIFRSCGFSNLVYRTNFSRTGQRRWQHVRPGRCCHDAHCDVWSGCAPTGTMRDSGAGSR
jgi:hypothetical protein